MFRGKVASNDKPSPSNKKEKEEKIKDPASTETTKGKKKRSRGRRRKGKSRNNKQEHKKQQQQQSTSSANSKKQHDAPMKKRDLYFSMTCAMVAVKGGGSVVARVTIVNWDMELVLDTFVHVPVPVSDFGDSGVTPSDIRKSITNVKAKSFAQVRQDVEKLLCGKILIGHHLTDKLTSLGLTHPITDVRDAAGFFGDADLRELTEVLLHRDLPSSSKTDYPFQCCAAVLDLYKSHRKEWEEDLIHQAQERQKLLMQQQQQQQQQQHGSPSSRYHYHPEHNHHSMQPYGNQHHPMMAPRAMEDNSSWFVRGANGAFSSQPPSNPALSSRAMQALSSYSHSPYDEAYERESSVSYDSSSYLDSSVDYSSSIFGNSSHGGTASVASWQEEQPPPPQESTEESNSSSWFRFGSKKAAPPPQSSSPSSSPYHKKMERRMSAVCEEPEDDLNEELQVPKKMQDLEDDRGREKSWFAFRRSKSPSHAADESADDLDKSRMHAAREIATLTNNNNTHLASMEQSTLDPFPEQTLVTDETAAAAAQPPIPEPASNERSSSWFSKIRRAKSPTNQAKVAPPEPATAETQSLEPTESTYTDDDWLQEVFDRKTIPAPSDDGSIIEEAPNSGSSAWFRFLRSPRSPKSNRSRLPSLENEFSSDELRNLKEPSLDGDDDNVWVGENGGGLSDADSNWTDSIFAARTRIATESTIPSIGTEEDSMEDDLSKDILIGMEQNLAFLNI